MVSLLLLLLLTIIINATTTTNRLANMYKSFGAQLEFITDRSQEGSQFCKGFGGIGGILRWKVDFQEMEMLADLDGMNLDNIDDDFM